MVIPMHVDGNHWIVGIVDFEDSKILIYDSGRSATQRIAELEVSP